MPILPQGSLLTLTDTVTSATANVAVSTVRDRTSKFSFKRLEFSHQRQREAPNVDGSMPMIQTLIGNRPVVVFSNCNDDEEGRNIEPDDDDYDNIYKRFDIKRFEIVGAASLAAETDKIFTIARNHSVLIARFDAFLQSAQANVSIDFLQTLQSETLSYLTTTGLTMTGLSLGVSSPSANCLITDYVQDVAYEIPTNSAGTTAMVLRSFTMTVEVRTLVADRSTSY